MKYFLRIFFALALAAISFNALNAETKTQGDYTLNLKASRDGSVYNRGETADFILKVSKKDGAAVEPLSVKWEITKDGVAPRTAGEAKLENGALKVSGSLAEAGFLKCKMYVKTPDGKSVEMLAGAGFDPLEIRASMAAPKDFAAYWKKQREILSAIPMNATMKPVEQNRKNVEAFDVKADSFNGLMTGYYARPVGAKPKSCPAIILPHGAGVVSSWLGSATKWADKGFIALDFNAHGIPNGQPKKFYEDLKNGELKNYPHFGKTDRDTIFFRTLYMRLMRAMDFLMAQPEWDGKILVANGTSQGGGQAIAAAALNPKVNLTVPFVPALCDHTGVTIGRTNGWPHYSMTPDGKLDNAEIEATRYIDAMNFAGMIKNCKAIFTVGYADPTCQPTSVYAAYSNVKAPKKMHVCQEARHTVPSERYAEADEEILKFVKQYDKEFNAAEAKR